ncbi:M3 family oligoendopeptidase [Gracilibacillus marinus]|uniref:M3 family oligoendopeptidase n=1 Tax=Gracilibacillus marinus TaxID=630535 RepID=A0ABV8VYX5_9BACI
MKYNQTWDLDSIFPGGTKSEALQAKIAEVKQQVDTYHTLLMNWQEATPTSEQFIQILQAQETFTNGLSQASTFVNMCHDAYMDDEHANVVKGQLMELASSVQILFNTFTKKIVAIPEEAWQPLIQTDGLKEVMFALEEIRTDGKRLLSDEEETLIAELSKDGLSAWSSTYDTVVSIMTIPYTDKDGETIELSIGQAMNRMYGDPDPDIRKQLFENWEIAWKKHAPIFADLLNHLNGYRLTLQRKHEYTNHLEEPLELNRMKKETLDAMWSAVSKKKKTFLQFLETKARLLGLEKLGWQDVDAPLSFAKEESKSMSYEEACDFIINNFATFGPKLASFAKKALENRWVEAENRPNKRPGGYCTSLPEWKESRIFMTFTETTSDTSTLAHELGHAFHSDVMKDLPTLNQHYAMNVAETASTFAETIIGNATVNHATTAEEKLSLLNAKLENATAMFMNIHARFLFEDAFYKERANGIVSTSRLNELMLAAQKEAYGDSLASYHPHFWCSKLHFFIDDVPFYNFPYTFGYLFSLGIYANYLDHAEGFEDKYIALLKDTGSMSVEDLAEKHLGVDITEEAFWLHGIELVERDVQAFLELANQ